ncbi:hypothetical protein CHUAL_008200 [Chamberlinius hualienensis]
MASFRYTHAVVCRVPNSFKEQAIGLSSEVNLEDAKKQHENYCRALRQAGVDVIELPADEALPDCVFVEDTAVVCNGTALMTKPGHPARRKEVDTMRAILKKELQLPIVEIKDEAATIDGGDVLFTGKEFFVGISSRTNEAGARAVAAAFPEYPVTPIKVSNGLHLKSSMAMAGPDILCVGTSAQSQEILRRVEREATYKYQTLTVPDDDAANCVYVNGCLLHRSDLIDSLKVFESKIDFARVELDLSELSKAKGVVIHCSHLSYQQVFETAKLAEGTVRIPVDYTDLGKAQAHLTCASIMIWQPNRKY